MNGVPVMKKRIGFTLVELLVVISIIAILLAVLMPALNKARDQAKNIICRSYVKQWDMMLTMYANANNGHFVPGFNVRRGMWMSKLRPYYSEADKARLCPKATIFLHTTGLKTSPFTAWGTYGHPDYVKSWVPCFGETGFYGSYGINAWLHDPRVFKSQTDPERCYDVQAADLPNYWKTMSNVKNPGIVPSFCDSVWEGTPVKQTDEVPNVPGVTNAAGVLDGMFNFFIPRHGHNINMAMRDGSAKSIPIKRLWNSLKFSPSFEFWEIAIWPAWVNW